MASPNQQEESGALHLARSRIAELESALTKAREYIQDSRDMLAECHRHPVTKKLEPADVTALENELLAVIDAVLTKEPA